MYQLQILDKLATVDSYEEGEIGKSTNTWIDVTLTGVSIKSVIDKALDFLGADEKSHSVDMDSDAGRNGQLNFDIMECEDGTTPSKTELEAWRKGNLNLWACHYTAEINKLVPVDLTKEDI